MKKMMKQLLATLMISIGLITNSYAVQIAYPDVGGLKKDNGTTIIPASSFFSDPHNTIIASSISHSTGTSVSITEVDALGIELWSMHYEQIGSFETFCYSIAESNQGYIMTGYYIDPLTNTNRMYLTEIGPLGTVLWSKTYDHFTVGLKVIKTDNDNYAVGGYYSNNIGLNDVYRSARILKTDGAGNPIWDKTIEAPDALYPNTAPRYTHIETIVEVEGDLYVSGASAMLSYVSPTSIPTTRQKVLSVLIDGTTGSTLWDYSISFAGMSRLDNTPHAGADAVYDAINHKIYLLVNYNVGDQIISVFEIDLVGNITNQFAFIHDVSSFIVPEIFYTNQIEIVNDRISIMGYLYGYTSGPDGTLNLHSPFLFSFDLYNPNNNTFDLYLNNSWNAVTNAIGFNGSYNLGYAYPLAHTPDIGILFEGTRLIGYHDSDFEFFHNFSNGVVCDMISGNLLPISELQYATFQNVYDLGSGTAHSLSTDATDYTHTQLTCENNPYNPFQSFMPLTLEDNENSGFELFPNPATNGFQILANANQIINKVKVFNLAGKLIFQSDKLNSGQIINLSDQAEGIYIVEVTSNEKTERVKLIKH